MKLEITFQMTGEEVPKDYRRLILHIFKTALTKANNGKYYDKYYELTKSKEYTFSVYFPGAKFETNRIIVSERKGKIFFSTSDDFTGFLFHSALLEVRKNKFVINNTNYLLIDTVRQVEEKLSQGNRALVKTAAPLCVRNHQRENNYDYYYSTEHEDFASECKRVVSYQLSQAGFSDEISENFNVTPVNTKKVIVDFYDYKIECSLGYFLLEGDSAAINYVLKAGLGSRKSAGFGYIQYQGE